METNQLTGHPFIGDHNAFNCSQCGKPRCLHRSEDVTIPSLLPINTLPIKSRWPDLVVGETLTDRKIDQYARRGFYSPEYRDQRREYWNSKQQRKQRSQGNFVTSDNGSLIYRPT